MARLFLRTASVMLSVCAVAASLVVLVRVSFAQGSHHLAGRWAYNQNQSDDASRKVHDAQASARQREGGSRGGGGGYPSGGGYPGGGGGYPSGGGYPGGVGYPGGIGVGMPGRVGIGMPGRGGMGRTRRGPSGGEEGRDSLRGLERLTTNPKMLTIRQDEKKIEIVNDSGGLITLFPDGKKHKETDADGNDVTLKSHWEGDQLVSEHKMPNFGKLKETYELSPDKKQLYVTTKFENSRLASPLVIRRVYDGATTAKSGGQ